MSVSIRLARTVVKDIPFRLLNAPGGNLVDDVDWVDGLTAPQWPTVGWFSGPNGTGTDYTASFPRDISAEAIASATHKHPTGTMGTWRKALGVYRQRVEPLASLPFGDYYMRVGFDPGTASNYQEDTLVTLVSPGDVSFSDSISTDMVTIGMTTSLTDDEIQALISEAAMWVRARLRNCRLNPEDFETSEDERLALATLYYTRFLVFGRDASSGLKFMRVQEGSKRIERAGQSDSSGNSYERMAKDQMDSFCGDIGKLGRVRLGVVRRDLPGNPSNGCC